MKKNKKAIKYTSKKEQLYSIINNTQKYHKIITDDKYIDLIFISSLFTALGFFDKIIEKVRCGIIVPITGFAHSMSSAALEYKNEGLVLGIGANVFKLAGTVILYGVVSVYFFGLIRLLVMGG